MHGQHVGQPDLIVHATADLGREVISQARKKAKNVAVYSQL